MYEWIVVDKTIKSVSTLDSHDLVKIRNLERQQKVRCPTCRQPMNIIYSENKIIAEHLENNPFKNHEPEDFEMRQAKKDFYLRLKQLFPNLDSKALAIDNPLAEINRLADITMVTAKGGRLAIEIQKENLTAEEVRTITEQYEQAGIYVLWLLDIRRLQIMKPRKNVNKQIRKTTIDTLETGLLSKHFQLLYLDHKKNEITWVRPPNQAEQLAALGDKKIGKLDCLVRQYKLSQLRIDQGKCWFEVPYEMPLPPAPALPANIQKRLTKTLEKEK